MIKRIFGKTGIEVTALGFGGYQITNEFAVPLATADDILDYVLKVGINLIDTAQLYGFGESEALIGRALRRNPQYAKKITVSTKIGYLDAGIVRINVPAAYTNKEQLMRTLKHSLWLLQRDNFDIVLLHEVDKPHWEFNYDTGDSPAYSFLEECKKAGLIRFIGVCSWDTDCLTKLVKTDRVDVVLCAGGITLLSKPMYDKLVPAAVKHNVGLMIGGGFGQNNPGLVMKDREKMKAYYFGSGNEGLIAVGQKLEKLYDIADEMDCTMVELAIRYILANEEIHSHVAGARELWHIEKNVASAEKGPLPKDIKDRIDGIQKICETPPTLEIMRYEKRRLAAEKEALKASTGAPK